MKKLLIISGLLAILGTTGCGSKHESKELQDKFQVTSPVKVDTSIVKDYVCQIRSIQHIELRALEKGYLQDIFVDEGQFVKKGQLMFRILPTLYEAEKQRAEAEAKYTEIEYLNTKQLAESNVVSQNELALAKAKYDKAMAELALAKVHLGFTEIRAPFDGIMNRLEVRRGSLVDEGELLSTLSDNSKMWVYFNVPESEYLEYQTDAENDGLKQVKLLMANNKIFKNTGVVEVIEADFNNETGNIAFRATFPNSDGLLRHGETGNILVETPLEDALIIPQKATFEVLDKKYVYVLDKDDQVSAREVEIGAEMNHVYQIRKGLTTKDKVLLEGLNKVQNGQKVACEYRKPKEILANLNLYAE
ncbi:MAG: efflux RND transporter periplasmic adaptor subunit [Bacteroidetes bacterium]|nr:efflux RND transporter periplasmic adaptor subunit [Bacteroidota bacterium]